MWIYKKIGRRADQLPSCEIPNEYYYEEKEEGETDLEDVDLKSNQSGLNITHKLLETIND